MKRLADTARKHASEENRKTITQKDMGTLLAVIGLSMFANVV